MTRPSPLVLQLGKLASTKGLKQRLYESIGSEGVYYVVRVPACWEVIAYRYDDFPEAYQHTEFWDSDVVPYLAFKWKVKPSSLANCPYGFPRGRVSSAERGFLILHGNDTDRLVSKSQIQRQFKLSPTICTWEFDEHERCQSQDYLRVRLVLGIKESWSHV